MAFRRIAAIRCAAALVFLLALSSPAHAAITATITRIDGNADNQAFPPYFRYANDGNLTIDFNVTDANYADLYYSKSRKAFTNLIFNDLNLSALKTGVSSLKGYWRFDNNSLIDYSGNGNTPMNVNATYIPIGKFGGAFGFTPGDQNGIQAGDSSSLDISGGLFIRTIVMAWVFVPAGTAYSATDFNKIAYKGDSYMLDLNGGRPRFYVSNGAYTCSVTATGPLVTGRWHHISGEYYNTGGAAYNKATIYVDGDANNYSVEGTCPEPPTALGTNDLNFVIGGNFNGNIDEVAVFTAADEGESSAYEDSNNMRYNVCQDLNFTNSTWCRWDWDTSAAADANYFIDINVFSTIDTNATDASDSNFEIWQNPAMNVNILALDGFSDANISNIFSYYADKNIIIDFNVSSTSNTHAPRVDLWYSVASGGQENSIRSDIDLLAAGVCTDTNFFDSTKCSYDFNISKTLVLDGNYFIDINFRDDIFDDANSTDYNFQIDNNAPVPNADYNTFWAANDQNVKLYCSIDANWGIAATNDDCYIPSNNTAVCNSIQAWGDATGLAAADINGYYRWALDIPANSQIFSALMQEKAYADCGSAPYSSYCPSTGYTIRIELMDADSQDAFNSGSPWGVATVASVDYSLTSAWTAGTWYSSPDLNTLLKSFVSRSGYAAGNYIGIRYSHNNVANNKAKIAASFNSGSAPAKLLATYGVGTGVKDCANILYRLDTDDTNAVSFGAWQAYNSAAGVPVTSDGNWAIDINVTDRARNLSDTNRVYVLVAKSISIISPPPGQVLSNPNVTFSYVASSKLGTVNAYWVKLDNQAMYTNNGTSTTYSATLTSGSHTFYVMANASGDVNSPVASVSFTINLGAGSAQCGDGVCGSGETAASCAADCPPVCGDGACTGTETPDTCPADCLIGCGDNICDPDAQETCSTCAADCGECAPGGEQPVSGEETVLEQTQTAQATIQQIEDVLRAVGFTISEIEAAKEAGTKLSITRTIIVEKKTAEEGIPESYESRITLAVTNTTSSALKNVRIVEVVPKSVANTADEITSARPFAVLKSDPVVQFSLSEIPAGGTAKVKYSLAKKLTEEQIADYMPAVPAYAIEAAEATCANVKCGDKNPCTDDLCFDGECAYVYAKDGTTCGFGEECMQGICRGVAFARPIAGGIGLDMMTITAIVVVVAAAAVGFAVYLRKH